MKKAMIYLGSLVAVGAIVAGVSLATPNKPIPVSKLIPKTVVKITPATPSYHLGDTRTSGNLSITLNEATSNNNYMGSIPIGKQIFEVTLTVTNNGTTPFISSDLFVNKSSIYAQNGTDTSTGIYITAFAGPCSAADNPIVGPDQTVSECIAFVVPNGLSVDTYFYDNLKWYL